MHWTLYILTDWLGLVPIGIAFGFAILGLVQLIRRKSLLKVDRDILILGSFYIVVPAAYEWTQEQRKIETAIRAQKDIANLARAAGLTDEARKASAKIDRLYDRYDQISAAAGLEKQYSRAYVRGYRQTKAGSGFTIRADNGIIKSVDKPTIARIKSPIEQRNSGKGNPNAILHFDRPLNRRQTAILNALPSFDSRTTVKKRDVNMRDLAALTAQTGCEYAMFTRKGERLIVRGNGYMTNIDAETARKMAADGWRWSGHTHPGVDFLCTQPSDGDYTILEQFFHNNSVIYNSRGEFRTYERKRSR